MTEIIKDPPHAGRAIATYHPGKDDYPAILYLPRKKGRLLTLLLRLKGFSVCRIINKGDPTYLLTFLPALRSYLTIEKHKDIAYVGEGKHAHLLLHLPRAKTVLIEPIKAHSTNKDVCVIHTESNRDALHTYRHLNEPKQRIALGNNLPWKHLIGITQWVLPIPQDVLDLPDIKEKKTDEN